MPKQHTASAATRHIHLTADAFREIAASAVEEVIDNSDGGEIHDLATWARKLRNAVGDVASRVEEGDL